MVEVKWERTNPDGGCSCRRLEVTRASTLLKLELQTCEVCIKIALNYLSTYLTEREQMDMFIVTHTETRVDHEESNDDDLFSSTDCDPRRHFGPSIS